MPTRSKDLFGSRVQHSQTQRSEEDPNFLEKRREESGFKSDGRRKKFEIDPEKFPASEWAASERDPKNWERTTFSTPKILKIRSNWIFLFPNNNSSPRSIIFIRSSSNSTRNPEIKTILLRSSRFQTRNRKRNVFKKFSVLWGPGRTDQIVFETNSFRINLSFRFQTNKDRNLNRMIFF